MLYDNMGFYEDFNELIAMITNVGKPHLGLPINVQVYSFHAVLYEFYFKLKNNECFYKDCYEEPKTFTNDQFTNDADKKF
jgi:hypothetical protein